MIDIKENSFNTAGVPYRYGGYTNGEKKQIKAFMNESFPHRKFGGGRKNEVIVEYPPYSVCLHSDWDNILNTVLVPELEVLDPKLRQKKIIVRFVDRLYSQEENIISGGEGMTIDGDWLIRIPYKMSDGLNSKNVETCTFVLMHELTEVDFWSKTHPHDLEAKNDPKTEKVAFISNNGSYENLLDEKIANRRALRAIRRMWPNARQANITYEEDQ